MAEKKKIKRKINKIGILFIQVWNNYLHYIRYHVDDDDGDDGNLVHWVCI